MRSVWTASEPSFEPVYPGLESVSMFWAYLAMPVGGLFSVLAIVGNWLDPQRLELETAQ